ncbi:MAG: prephenate dehydrogenase/arogenate dehydrogenase family protein [Atopobiaceae bacterium]|nr:prephenate dehydrogenase/arogenate dehydrogenase family protein [Atopobiaceae bacterium]
MIPNRIGIVGLGLIGGSFAKAFAAAGREVYVENRTHAAVELALIETADGELDDEVIPTCETIILASFPAACISWLESHADMISPGALVMDACGTKTEVCRRCFAIARKHEWFFLGAHPMAGSENSGFEYSRSNMFMGAPIVFCPPEMDDIERADLLERAKKLLEPCGFTLFSIAAPEEHDAVIAYTSQLPHIIANAYIKSPTNAHRLGFSGGSWRDLTRISKCNVNMWTELFIQNNGSLVAEIDGLIRELVLYRDAIASSDEESIRRLLAEGDRLKRESDAK